MPQPVVSSLLQNSLDYFLTAAENARKDDVRSLKNSVLHAAASVELALKARLCMEHWSLIFEDVDKANEAALHSGDFKSADPQTVIDRLKKIAHVPLPEDDLSHLDGLRRMRNKVLHFAAPVNKEQASSLVAKCFSFLEDLWSFELRDALEEFAIYMVKDEITEHLRQINRYVEVRLEAVKGRLDQAEYLLSCPVCQQRTVRLGVGSPDCAFCGFPIDAVTLAGDIAARGVEVCPECGEKTLALDLQTDEGGYLICTSCATRVEWHSSCPRCGKLGGITGSFCGDCAGKPQGAK